MDKNTFKILIAATGSVAALKIPTLIKSLLEPKRQKYNFEIRLIVTERSKNFFDKSEIPSHVEIYDDDLEWQTWKKRGDPVLHIELGKWADVMAIVPLDANTLGKMALGLCDNLVTCTTRAWDMSKPLLFCPAMNTRMWDHPITAKHIATLREWGHIEVPPIKKLLMCGDFGVGGMAEVDTIVDKITSIVEQKYAL